jgi:glycosyltransferase involved in cell wall biosynthesis
VHVVFVQFGDYRDAVARFGRGEEETYYAQRYSVEFVATLARTKPVSVVCLNSAEHDEMLANGVRSCGLRLYREHGQLEVLRLLSRLQPTHVVLAAPIPAVVAWAIATRRRLLPIFADSFDTRRPGARLRHWALSRLLRSSSITIVANHNVNASRGLVRLGVPASKVVPWDWPPQHTPHGVAPKSGRARADAVRALFVGSVTEDKGVGDAIEAVASLRARGLDARLTVIGQGRDSSALESRARALGLRDVVEFRGRTSNEEALEAMRLHDVVLVPSRHSYPEGLPMTIYEAFCSRTPLVVSDHPMLDGRASRDGHGCAGFRSRGSRALHLGARALRGTLPSHLRGFGGGLGAPPVSRPVGSAGRAIPGAGR